MRGVIHVAPNASAADSDSARRRIDPCVFDRAEVNDQTVVANSQASGVMTSAADCDEQIIFSGKVYAANYVSHVRAPRDQARLFVDHSIVNLASIIVIVVARLYQSSAQVCFEIGDGIFVEHDEVSLKRSFGQHNESRHFH